MRFRTRQDAERHLERLWDRGRDDAELWAEMRAVYLAMTGHGLDRAREHWRAHGVWRCNENGRIFREALRGKYPKRKGRKAGRTVSGRDAESQLNIAYQVVGARVAGRSTGEAIEFIAARYGLTTEAARKAYERNRASVIIGM